MDSHPDPEVADRFVHAISVALAIVAIVLAAALAFAWTPVPAPHFDHVADPAGELPF